jgi:hypothetical protein
MRQLRDLTLYFQIYPNRRKFRRNFRMSKNQAIAYSQCSTQFIRIFCSLFQRILLGKLRHVAPIDYVLFQSFQNR